jgi:hypothetical protein
MQYLYEHENDLPKNEGEFCYALAKLVKKVSLQGELIYARPDDYAMAYFFKKAMAFKMPLFWVPEIGKEPLPISINEPLPITIRVFEKNKTLVAELMEKELFRKNPLSFLTFRDERQTFCFSSGVLIERLPQDFETFLNEFLDKDKIVFESDEVLRFIQHVYMPNRKLLFWKIQVDFLSFIPQEVTPIPLLRIGYSAPTLTPTLFFQYDREIISPDFNKDVVADKRTGKKYQRLMDMELIYQQDLMTLFNEFHLPFLLQSPGDIALFMDKVVPLLIERGWQIQSDVPEFNVLPDPVELSFAISSSGQDWFHFSILQIKEIEGLL